MAQMTDFEKMEMRDRRRRLVTAIASFVVGIGLLVAFALAAERVEAANDRLVSQGAKVTGAVTAVTPDRKNQDGSVAVSYEAAGRRLIRRVNMGHDANRFTVGQKVDVYYDRHAPARMTIAGENNQPAWSIDAMAIMFVLGLVFIAAALTTTWRWLRSR